MVVCMFVFADPVVIYVAGKAGGHATVVFPTWSASYVLVMRVRPYNYGYLLCRAFLSLLDCSELFFEHLRFVFFCA